mmetsp:Transcript_57446/g.181868  ORF Transcript_57446/g.181868 Transcript_57446/m.181868 type:complete len:274 (-) Transcript_57446:4371-5192(-)
MVHPLLIHGLAHYRACAQVDSVHHHTTRGEQARPHLRILPYAGHRENCVPQPQNQRQRDEQDVERAVRVRGKVMVHQPNSREGGEVECERHSHQDGFCEAGVGLLVEKSLVDLVDELEDDEELHEEEDRATQPRKLRVHVHDVLGEYKGRKQAPQPDHDFHRPDTCVQEVPAEALAAGLSCDPHGDEAHYEEEEEATKADPQNRVLANARRRREAHLARPLRVGVGFLEEGPARGTHEELPARRAPGGSVLPAWSPRAAIHLHPLHWEGRVGG